MRIAALAFAITSLACAQNSALLERGLDVYNKTCATGYCHGVKGTSGGAPRLAARGFDDAYVTQTIRLGIHGTGMPAFGTMLERADLLAVIAYVDNLNGAAPNPLFAPGPEPKKLPPEAQKGRQLFADQVRAFDRCSTCHQVDGIGIAVAAPITSVPENVAALRTIATPHIETATADGETFPALVLNSTKAYDLTTTPPVLRTFLKGAVTFQEGSPWRHESTLNSYNDQELDSILTFLHAVTK